MSRTDIDVRGRLNLDVRTDIDVRGRLKSLTHRCQGQTKVYNT